MSAAFFLNQDFLNRSAARQNLQDSKDFDVVKR